MRQLTFIILLFSASVFAQNGVKITSTATSPTQQNPVPLTIKFDQPINGFERIDVDVKGGDIMNFQAGLPNYSLLANSRLRDFNINFDVVIPDNTNFEPSKDAVIAIDIDAEGYSYALTLKNGVFKYNPNGTPVTGNPIIKSEALNEARDIAIGDDEKVYIADSGSDKILIFNKTGGSTIGNIGDQKVSSPTGLAINFQNLIYVADTGNDRIVIFDPSGVQVGEINHGGGPGFDQMNDPIRLAVDNKNIVYVSDSGNNRIQIYNSDGTYKATIDGNTANLNNPGSLIVDNYGFLYVADFAGVNLNVFLEFENITTADILNLATNLENFRIQVFRTNSINEPPRTIKNGINIPIDLSFKPCGYLAVNNGDAKTDGKTIVIPGIPPKVVLPVNFLFDLKLYNRLPDTFTADLSIAVECTPVTITVPAGVGQNKDCQQAPATASNKFEILWDETAPIVESCSEEAVIKVESGFTIPNYFNIYEFTASDNCEGSLTFRQTPPSTTVITENTTVNIVAIDGAGNESAACTFQLVIAEEEDPSFDCDIPPATLDLDENCDYPERDFSFLITNQQNFVDGIFIEQKEERVGYILKVNIKVYHGENANDTFIGECNFEVVLLDRKVPLIESCNSSPVNLNLTSGTDFTIPDYSDRITYSDNCDADPTIIQIPKPGSVVDENTTVSLTVKDASGNISEVCSFSIIFDKTSNGISCHLTELPLGADGTAVLDAANVIDGNPNDPAIKSLVVEPSNFTCENLGLQPVKVKVTYDDGSTSECTTQVKVTDVLVPQIECPREPIVHTFDPEQGFVVPDYSKEFSVTDNCNFTITQVPAPGTVIFGSRQIDFIAEDSSNNTSFCYFSLILNASQDFEITSCPSSRIEDLNGKCEFELLDYTSEVQTSVPYSKVIQQPAPGTIISEDTEVTLTATLDGESVSCFFNVQLTNFSEVLLYCLNDLTVDANGDGTYILEDYTRLANSDGACGALTYTQDPPPGTIINSDTEVTLTVTDENGKTDDCSFKVNFKESNPGTVECKPTDLYLTQSGDNTLDPRELYKGDANDPLIESFSVDKDYFTCEDLGPQPVVLTVHFKDGTSQDCSTEIVVKDRIDPDVFCIAPGKEFTLINGSVTIDVNDLLADLDDNCGVLDYWLSQETFTSAGTKTVTINAEDSSGNTNSCTTTIEVIAASTSPGSCKPAIIYLDASGSATLDPAEVFEGDPDAGSIEDMIVNRNSFTCDDLGEPVEVNLTVKYANGTNTTCTALVTVKDIIAPEIVCVEEFTLHLNEAGVGKITPEIFDRGSSDNCGFQMSLSKENFDLDDVGEQEVILTVTDAAGNTSTCITTVTVEAYDEENPGISCVDELTLPLSQTGDFFLELNYTGDDENEDYTISKETFSCEDIGTQFITVTYWGEYTGTCEIKVTVVDDMAPVIECLEEIDVRLNASGTASLSIEDLDLEYSDNCSVADSALSRTNFTTADLGKSEITFSVTDGSGNTSTCTTTVNVLPFEGEEPQAIECVDLHVIQIKENGKAILNPRELFTGGTGTTQFTVSKDTFTCLDIGENTVTLEYTTPTESGACEIKVVVEDPLQICGEPVDPSNGDYIIMYPNPSLGIVRFQTSPGLEIHRVEVFDMRGRYLFEKVYDQNSIFDRKLDLQEYQSGVYTILIYTNGKEYLKRAIIRN